jgi:hypothetical protein
VAVLTDAEIVAYLGLSSTPTLLTTMRPYAENAVSKFIGYPVELAQYTEFYPTRNRVGERDNLVDVSGNKVVFYGDDAVGNFLYVKHLPVRNSDASGASDPSVFEDRDAKFGQGSDSPFAAATELTLGTDFYLDLDDSGICRSGNFIRTGSNWPSTVGSLKLVYHSGYTADELDGNVALDMSDIKLAMLITASFLYKQAVLNGSTTAAGLTSGPMVQESLGDYSYMVAQGAAERMSYTRGAIPPEAMRLVEKYRNYRGVFG